MGVVFFRRLRFVFVIVGLFLTFISWFLFLSFNIPMRCVSNGTHSITTRSQHTHTLRGLIIWFGLRPAIGGYDTVFWSSLHARVIIDIKTHWMCRPFYCPCAAPIHSLSLRFAHRQRHTSCTRARARTHSLARSFAFTRSLFWIRVRSPPKMFVWCIFAKHI